jgi:hypothetical protein
LKTISEPRAAYVAFTLDQSFFKEYKLLSDLEVDNIRVPLKPCLAVFKNINSIESCTMILDMNESKLVFDLQCKLGIRRVYKLFLEDGVLKASYNRAFPNKMVFKPGPLLESLQNNFHHSLEEITMHVSRNYLRVSSYVDEAKCKCDQVIQ